MKTFKQFLKEDDFLSGMDDFEDRNTYMILAWVMADEIQMMPSTYNKFVFFNRVMPDPKYDVVKLENYPIWQTWDKYYASDRKVLHDYIVNTFPNIPIVYIGNLR